MASRPEPSLPTDVAALEEVVAAALALEGPPLSFPGGLNGYPGLLARLTSKDPKDASTIAQSVGVDIAKDTLTFISTRPPGSAVRHYPRDAPT